MNNIVSTENMAVPMRAKHRATGEMGTVTALEPTAHGTFVHVTWDDADAADMPSTLRVEYVMLTEELLTTAGPYSYYDAMLAKINTRVSNSAATRKEIAAAVGCSQDTLRRKLNGKSMLTVRNIGSLSRILGCRMSELV
ncbi:helix-turn-helix domain-containing protein [Arthrobacter antibioticus]|uniref:helix-turn-helix domain-containing protein n=1 Tax=Arthrobacter sp. H35-MC1 TaxID=3046203 RepID=UPI0024BB72FD|nr:helix-turn-helix transcriptional regulator [Arthrobacter sp. H35-MC1]MDJ0317863.1 helix-turn-helix transcriptional regulator [Arthrobacter sp. H35-MC1]